MGLVRFLLAIAVVLEHMGDVFGTAFGLLPGTLAVQVVFEFLAFTCCLFWNRKISLIKRFSTRQSISPSLSGDISWCASATGAGSFLFGCTLAISRESMDLCVPAYVFIGAKPTCDCQLDHVGSGHSKFVYFGADKGFQLFYFALPSDAPDGSKWAGEFRTIDQAWSIGVEIWFYLIAPFLITLRSRWIVLVGLGSIILRRYGDKQMAYRPITFFRRNCAFLWRGCFFIECMPALAGR